MCIRDRFHWAHRINGPQDLVDVTPPSRDYIFHIARQEVRVLVADKCSHQTVVQQLQLLEPRRAAQVLRAAFRYQRRFTQTEKPQDFMEYDLWLFHKLLKQHDLDLRRIKAVKVGLQLFSIETPLQQWNRLESQAIFE